MAAGKSKKTVVIGLTGGPGVGKTEASAIFKSKGYKIINADKIGHSILASNQTVKHKLIKLLGDSIIDKKSKLIRPAIGILVFSDPNLMAEFNAIIHPVLLRELKIEIKQKSQSGKGVLVDAALIFEWGIADWFDYIIVVDASRTNRLKRLAINGLSMRQAAIRIGSQIPQRIKRNLADFVITNNSTLRKMEKDVSKFINLISD